MGGGFFAATPEYGCVSPPIRGGTRKIPFNSNDCADKKHNDHKTPLAPK